MEKDLNISSEEQNNEEEIHKTEQNSTGPIEKKRRSKRDYS